MAENPEKGIRFWPCRILISVSTGAIFSALLATAAQEKAEILSSRYSF
jgi:hypothetical protein